MSVSDDGKMLKEAFLQIPKGGEVKIEKDDLKVALGEQTIKFTKIMVFILLEMMV
jgi:hypothetical protein